MVLGKPMFMGSHSPQGHLLISFARGATEVYQECDSSAAFPLGLPARDCCSVPGDVGGVPQCHFTEEMDWGRFPVSQSLKWSIRRECYLFLFDGTWQRRGVSGPITVTVPRRADSFNPCDEFKVNSHLCYRD